MTTYYRMHDNAARAQQVSIRWEMITESDDSGDRPDEHDEGFWPSQDPDARGNYAEEMRKATERMRHFDLGLWEYVGVIARAHISVPIGGNSFASYTLDSPGLWGIESDCEKHIAEMFKEEKAALIGHMETMGAYFCSMKTEA